MSKVLAVVGASGNQGGTLISYFLNDEALSKEYSIRAITRDPELEKAIALQKQGVQVVKGDINDMDSLVSAFDGAHTVFGMSLPTYQDGGRKLEFDQGKNIADAAVRSKVEMLIWSSAADTIEASGGKYTRIDHFNAKADVEQYIRKLPIKSIFFLPALFMQGFLGPLKPMKLGDGVYGIVNIVDPEKQLPFFDTDDTGKFIAHIIKNKEKYYGQKVAAFGEILSVATAALRISKFCGKDVKYIRLPLEEFKQVAPVPEDLLEMFGYLNEFDFFGLDPSEYQDKTPCEGKPHNFDEFLINHPIKLE